MRDESDDRRRPAAAPNDWDPDAYDGSHGFVHEYGTDVLGLLDPDPGERVLDLGCGTGHLTARIADAGANPVGVDRAGEMVAAARESYPTVAFVRADARALPFAGGTFDAAFSNATLHWVDAADQPAALRSVARVLRPGGRFVAELGGAGNVSAIVDAVREAAAARGHETANPWFFPTVDEYAGLLADAGFEVRYARLFDRPTRLDNGAEGLDNWLDAFGDGLLGPVPVAEREDVVRAAADRLRGELFEGGTWTADYRRLRMMAVREA